MGKVRTGLAVSLDGLIGGPNDVAEAPMGGVATTPWMCRSLLSAARSHQRGSTKDRRSPSSPTAWKAPWSKRKRSPGTRMSAWAPPASCSSASERDSWTSWAEILFSTVWLGAIRPGGMTEG
jgi:hypothetical protein